MQSETCAIQTGDCRAGRRFVILISLAFLLIANEVTSFSLSSSSSIATKSIPSPHKWLEQGVLPVKSQYSRRENSVFLPRKGWRESLFAFPLKFSVSLWNNMKHNIYVKNGNISNWNIVLLQYEHFPKKEDENF